MSKLSQKHLLGIKNINEEDIRLIFDTAGLFQGSHQPAYQKGTFFKGYYDCQYFF